MKSCVIVGAGGHGRVVLDILRARGLGGRGSETRLGGRGPDEAGGDYSIAGFLDSNESLRGRHVDGLKVLGTIADLPRLRDELGITAAIVAIGDNGVRRDFAERVVDAGLTLLNAIHPSANIAGNASLGSNIVVAAGALVCAHCQIGDSVILNTGCIIDHETMIGTATHICPGARLAGRVTVESGAFVGIGATVIQSIRIGYEAVIGAGAVVIENVPPLTTVVGVPAKPIKDIPDGDELTDWLMPEFMRATAHA